MYRLLIIFISFLLLFKFIIVKGIIEINEIKDEEIFPHQLYPIDSMSAICRFYVLISVISDQSGEPIITFNLPADSEIIPKSTLLDFSNITARFYLLDLYYVEYGSNLITLTATLNTEQSNYDITLICEEPNYSSFSTKVLGSFTNQIGTGEKVIYSKLVNSKYPIIVESAGTPNEHAYFKSFTNIYSNVFQMTLGPLSKLLPVIFDPTWNDTIPFSSENIVHFNIDSIYYNSGNSTPISTDYYPTSDLISSFIQMGQDYSPVIEFTLDSNLIYPFNVIIGPSGFETIPRLISSENGINRYSTFINTTNGSYSFYKKLNSQVLSSILTLSSTNIQTSLFSTTIDSFDTVTLGSIYSMYYFKSSSTSIYNFEYIDIQYKSRHTFVNFPFGFNSGTNSACSLDLSFITTISSQLSSPKCYIYPIGSYQKGPIGSPTSTAVPSLSTIVNSFESIKLDNSNYLIRIEFTDINGFNYIQFSSFYNKYYGKENLVSGSINGGTIEFVFDIYSYDSSNDYLFLIANDIDTYQSFKYGFPYSILQPTSTLKIKYFNDFIDIESIKDVTYYLYNYKFTTKTANRMYFNISDNSIDVNRPMAFQLNVQKGFSNSIDPNQYYPIKWNSKLKLFQVDFFMQPYQVLSSGYLPFIIIINYKQIIYSESLPNEYQLKVNSDKLDLKGPIFETIQQNPVNMNANIGWLITISDDINKFMYGTIIVNGEMDSSRYEFNLVANSTLNPNNQFEIYLNISQISVSQDYIITNVTLCDSELNLSHYSYYKSALDISNNVDPTINPFIKYLSDPKINRITYTSPQPTTDTSPPELVYFSSSRNTVDVGSLDRDIEFSFAARDMNSGLKIDQLPIVYLMDRNLEVISFKSSIVSINSTTAIYKSIVTVPVGFSFSSSILVSVYGFINNGGYYSGFSSYNLRSANQVWSIDTTFNMDQPIITSSNKFTSYGGDLFIYGKGLNAIKKAEITFQLDDGVSQIIDVTSNITANYNRALLISGVASTLKPITVKLYKDISLESNQYEIVPIHFGIPDPEPLPTNPPQQCFNNCNSRGTCTANGCVCKSPYIGVDCSSQIIIIPQPSINKTDPSVEIPIYSSDNSSGSSSSSSSNVENIIFKSFISLVSLREINIYNIPVKNYTFDQWIYTNINETTNQYYTTIKSGQDLITNITTTIQYYNETTVINFASENITINPSSIKYTIHIGQYNFISNLNSLELVMNAKFESLSKLNNICSSKEFGNTTSGDNSNYLKIQIDNHSLYGVYLKRGIVDNKVVTISNQLLDSSLNSIIGSSSTQVQSFIGIVIPHFNDHAIIDPDFSTLLNSNSASSSSSNSVCSKSNSGLTSSKLAGIIIGCVGFASIIVISVIYHLIKKKQQKEFKSSINMKIKNNNSNL